MRCITIPRITAVTMLLLFTIWAHEPVRVTADAAAVPTPACVHAWRGDIQGVDYSCC